jgi:hypothetical protein
MMRKRQRLGVGPTLFIRRVPIGKGELCDGCGMGLSMFSKKEGWKKKKAKNKGWRC